MRVDDGTSVVRLHAYCDPVIAPAAICWREVKPFVSRPPIGRKRSCRGHAKRRRLAYWAWRVAHSYRFF